MVDTVNLRTNKPTIFFDIETGGFWANRDQSIREQRALGVKSPAPRVSSILSISYKMGEDSATFYSKPVRGSWVSQFSQENILPQLQGKQTITEEDSIRNFINVLKQNPEANIAGYNIKGFDLSFIQSRAQQYGLGSAFSAALRGRVIEDTSYLARDIMMESISSHLYRGTFKEELGGRTFTQAEHEYFGPGGRQLNRRSPRIPYQEQPLSFRMLSQAEAYVRGGYKGKVAGWKLGDTFSAYANWANLPESQKQLASAAHESLADVKMTEILHEGIRSGKFQQFVETEEFAKSWLESVTGHRAASSAADKTAGKFWDLEQATTGRITPRQVADSVSSATASLGRKIEDAFYLPKDPMPRSARKWAIIMAASAAALWAGAGYLAFSGSDDEYNVIEGLRHDGIASEFRRDMTEFGSGWKGTKVQIDPEILEFREKVWDNKERRAELQAELDIRQKAAQSNIGSLNLSDLFEINTSTIKGINQNQRDLKAVRLENFRVLAEDADSLVLRRKGLFNRLFGDDILIRLAGIDAPETDAHGVDPLDFIRKWQSQVGGEEATSRLQELIDSSDLSLLVKTEGQSYGRYMGVLANADGDNINLRLIEEGLVSALPFGKASEDLVRRSDTLDAERRAKFLGLGIHQYARYKAIEATNSILGSDITYNTLTRIDKLAQNLNLGAYGSWLESLGSEKRELTAEEIGLARKFGYSLRSQYGRRFSGRDDSYNTIEGLGHSGIAHQVRRQLTEFGSGWLGYGAPVALGLATALVSGDLSMGLSAGGGATAGASIGYLYGGTKGAIAGIFAGGAILGGLDYGAEQTIGGIAGAAVAGLSLSVGTSLKSVGNMKGGLLYDTNKAVMMRLAKTSNIPENQIAELLKFQYGHNPLTDAAGFSSTASRAVLAQINAARSFTLGKEGYLFEGINKVMDLGESAFNNKHFSSIVDATLGSPRLQSLAREYGAINLVPPRDIAKAVGIDVLEGLPMALVAGGLSYVFGKRESAEQSRYNLSEINARTLDTKKLTPEQFKMLTTSIAPVFGKDDAYNTIEGLPHGGMGQQMRRQTTPFGSGWDALRNLTKAGEKFEDMLKSNEFKQALSGAKQVAQLGEGGFGAAYKMTGTFRGQEFSFIRKIGVIGEHEASIMRRFQDSFSPTVYSDPKFVRRGEGPLGRNTDYYSIDMELFEGQEFKHLLKKGTLPESAVHKYEAALKQMHEAGLVHGDAHAGNVFLTKEGNVGLIDFGLSGPEGREFGSISQGAIKQLEVVKPGGAVGKELDRRQLGHHIPEEGWGFFTERDKRLDLVAMDVMREKAGMALDPGSKTNAMRGPARASAKSKAAVLENSAVSEKLLNNSSDVFAELQNFHVSNVFTNTPPERGTYGVFTNTPPSSLGESKAIQSILQKQASRQLTVGARGGKNSRM